MGEVNGKDELIALTSRRVSRLALVGLLLESLSITWIWLAPKSALDHARSLAYIALRGIYRSGNSGDCQEPICLLSTPNEMKRAESEDIVIAKSVRLQ